MGKTNKFHQVIVFGGTHGNEMSGIYLVKKWLDEPMLLQKTCHCTVTPVIANPEAVKLCKRYKDCDMNRQFIKENFNSKTSTSTPYEIKRAQELYQLYSDDDMLSIGTSTSGQTTRAGQLLLDLHNTTANVKCCLIISDIKDIVSLHMAQYIQSKFPTGECSILHISNTAYGNSRSIMKYGLGIEIGPQPQGVLRADICKTQEKTVFYALEFVNLFNSGCEFTSNQVTTFNTMKNIPFPLDDNDDLNGIIHPEFQDHDFEPLVPKDPIFQMRDGSILTLGDVYDVEGAAGQALSAVFINEAAYYEKRTAFCVVTKTTINLPSLNSDTYQLN